MQILPAFLALPEVFQFHMLWFDLCFGVGWGEGECPVVPRKEL